MAPGKATFIIQKSKKQSKMKMFKIQGWNTESVKVGDKLRGPGKTSLHIVQLGAMLSNL